MKDGSVYFLRTRNEDIKYSNKNNNTINNIEDLKKPIYKYKIGFTNNLNQRMKTHRTSNIDFELAYVINNVDMEYEKFLHRYFDDYKIALEFYEDYNGIISNFIKRDKITRRYLEGNHWHVS